MLLWVTMFIIYRLLGALLSAHLLIEDKSQPFGNLEPEWYNGELLEMASDLASRFMPAFDNSKTGLPHPRVGEVYIETLFTSHLLYQERHN